MMEKAIPLHSRGRATISLLPNSPDLLERSSLEELAVMSEESAVRREFDDRNVRWMRLIAIFLFCMAGIELIYTLVGSKISRLSSIVPLAHIALLVVMIGTTDILARETRRRARVFRRLAATVSRNLRGWTLGFFVLQYILPMLIPRVDVWVAWAMLSPFLMMGLRLAPVERLLLHGLCVAVATVALLSTPPSSHGDSLVGIGVGIACMNALAAGGGLLTTRGFRRGFLSRWRAEHRNAVEQVRMRDELRYARELQLSMLPDGPPTVDWLDIAAISIPANEVGGDYFDYFPLPDRRMAIVSGDVAGHGLASGLVLSALRGGFVLLRDALGDPAAVLRRLDDMLARTNRRRTFVAASVLLLDRERSVATVASAGHPPLLVRRRGASHTSAIELFALPLGARLGCDVRTSEMPIEPGDTFVLHTDGIYETLNDAGESYGIERMMHVIESTRTSATALRDEILRDLERFRGNAAQTDDVTLVVVIIT